MKVEIKENNGKVIIKFINPEDSQISVTNIKEIRDRFNDYIKEKKITELIIDLENIEFVDSAGIGFFVEAFNYVRNSGGKFLLKNVNNQIYEILEMTNLTKFIPVEKKNG